MRLRTAEDFIRMAAATPTRDPIGLTAQEIYTLETVFGNPCQSDSVLVGRRIVQIPWDWER